MPMIVASDTTMPSVGDVWSRRLQLAYEGLVRGEGRSITTIAFDHGFNSSAHFSTMFRRKYGVSPRDIVRTRQ